MTTNRRQFLKTSGLVSGAALLAAQIPPVDKLAAAILRETLQKAGADTQYIDTKYISVTMNGAPPRWMWDHVWASHPGDTITTSVLTNYVASAGTYKSGEYRTINYKGVQVPTIWGTQVPTAATGMRPCSDLLDNMIIFRGFGTGTDGHPTNAARQTYPLPGAGSIAGWVADYSSTLFKAAAFPDAGSYSGYSSLKGTAASTSPFLGNRDYASLFLNPFAQRTDATNLATLRESYKDLVNQSQDVLSRMAAKDSRNFASVQQDQQQALLKIKTGITDLVSAWPALFNKYNTLITNTLRNRTAAGFNDLPIVAPADDGTSIDTPWMLDIMGAQTFILQPGSDIRDLMNTSDATQMASTFALCEFMMTNNLVSSYELNIQYIPGVSGRSVRTTGSASHAPTAFTTSLFFDQHTTGYMVGTYLNSCLYRALTAALLELRNALQAASLFNKTVIHVNQDFGRSPRNTGGGSDHHFDGMVASVITGMNTAGPLVIGNILATGTAGQFDVGVYTGCTGHLAPTKVTLLDGTNTTLSLTPGHVASSIAILLGLPENPWFNTSTPLIGLSSGTVTSLAEAKLV